VGGWKDTAQTTARVSVELGGRAARLQLVVVGRERTSTHTLPAVGKVTVGREPSCEVCVDDPSISRAHVVLHLGDAPSIEDLGSKNGTRVSGRTLTRGERARIEPGQTVEIGQLTLLLHEARGPALSTPPSTSVGPGGPSTSKSAPPTEAGDILVLDPRMKRVFELVDKIAPADVNVLVLGETGVGKELVAEAIHRRSRRGEQRMVRLNCAALPEALLESELFGHEKGAFTGAHSAKPGLFEAAHGGTVFLDEVGDLPLSLQAKLLRVLEERRVLRLGALEPKAADVRFVAATNRDLEAEASAGRFRADLFYRLSSTVLSIPPLRERVCEIAPLARRFADDASRKMSRTPAPRIDEAAMALLVAYRWPGNVRELRNVVEQAVLLCSGDVITSEHLPIERLGAPPSTPMRSTMPPPSSSAGAETGATSGGSLRSERHAFERARILDALQQCAGNQTRAAELLGMSRRALSMRLDSLGIARPRKPR
jgi:transcriptional regulator with GAF, ATPase, and Fis domain